MSDLVNSHLASSHLAYSHGTSTTPLLGETIGDNLRRISAAQPDAECIVSCEQRVRMTYGEFDRAVDDLGAGLIDSGLVDGDRIGIWSPNRVEWTLLQYAAARTGVRR